MKAAKAPAPPPPMTSGPCHHCFKQAQRHRVSMDRGRRVVWLCEECNRLWQGLVSYVTQRHARRPAASAEDEAPMAEEDAA